MDLLEYKQIAEAVKYIERYNPGNKFSDWYYMKKLDNFEIKDKIAGRKVVGKGKDRCEIPYCYRNGCTEEEVNIFRKILFSAAYTYKKIEDELISETDEQQLKKDVKNDTYKGKTIDDYEAFRLEAVDKVKNLNNFVDKLETIVNCSRKIHKGLMRIAEYKLIKKAAADEKIRDAAERMIKDNISLTKIAEYLQTDILKLNELYLELLKEKKITVNDII